MEIYPILLNNGEAKITCDGVMRFMNTAPLKGKKLFGTYLFGNLLTDPGYGADVVIWSPSYGPKYPPPYVNGPASQWGALGNLHIFNRPNGHTGGRQGEAWRSFAPAYVTINDFVQLVVIGWGGGTLECYAQVFVSD